MSQNFTKRLSLFSSRAFVESRDNPIHLALREVAAQIAAQPHLGAGEIDVAVMSLIDFVRVVELAKVFGVATLVVAAGCALK